MTSVQLALPDEILQEVNFPYDGVRDASGITLAIDGINLTASIVTLAAIKQYAPRLASAIRRWLLHQNKDSIILTVKGGEIDMNGRPAAEHQYATSARATHAATGEGLAGPP